MTATSFKGRLGNYYSSRPTSANIGIIGDGSLTHFMATSSMTTAKPPVDSHILHSSWDNTGGWDVQLALAHGTYPAMYLRGMNEGTWGSWNRIPVLRIGTGNPDNSVGLDGDIYIKY